MAGSSSPSLKVYCFLFSKRPSFFFTCPSTTEIYTLSLHDALPILIGGERIRARAESHGELVRHREVPQGSRVVTRAPGDRKSTRLNSSHANISYAVFCLKKKKRMTFPILGYLLV